jgi:biotin/methionine sulfoxide reductase
MLLNPGGTYRYNGKTKTYPDIRLVYWAGGNPFHHHQDLNRLRRAFARVDTLVVHELGWTATARHADFVLPATMTLEREDIGGNANDPLLVPMQRIAPPYGKARDDYAIFSDLAERLGARDAFTEGRTVRQWLEHLYEPTRKALVDGNLPAPRFDEFWNSDGLMLPQAPDDGGMLRRFRDDPEAGRLATPSGKIEIFSETIASFGETDCPGHPTWLTPVQVPDDIRRGVVQLSTGAWYDPADPKEEAPLCVHGNPNVLTRDVGTSALAQGCTGQLTTAEVERFNGNLPPIQAYDPPVASKSADAVKRGS